MSTATPNIDFIPHRYRQQVEDELDSGERLLWIGQPRPGRIALRGVAHAVMGASAVVGGVYMAATATSSGFAWGMGLFILIGVGLLFAPLRMWWKGTRTVYAVTDRRALILEGGFSQKLRTYGPEELSSLECHRKADGSGDIIIDREVTEHRSGTQQRGEPVGFLGIERVKEVEQLLQDLTSGQAAGG